jgi:hypothetical protein
MNRHSSITNRQWTRAGGATWSGGAGHVTTIK